MRRIFPFVLGAVLFSVLMFFTSLPRTDLFELEQMDYTLFMRSDGAADVTEVFTMKFKKPFRYVTWALDMPEGVSIEDFRYELIQGPPLMGGVRLNRIGQNSVDLLFQFSRSMEEYVQTPPGGLTVQLKFSYTVKSLLIHGKDFTQLFIKYLQEAPTIVKKLNVRMVFPLEFGEARVYHHPWGLQVSSNRDGRIKEFIFRNVPLNSFVEGRYVFPKLSSIQDVRYQDVSLQEVLKYEHDYTLKNALGLVLTATYALFVVFFPLYLYRKFGREFSVTYDAEYEREIPYRDPPDVVNGVVKRLCSLPDEDGLNALLLNAVKEKRAEFITSQNGQVVGVSFATNSDDPLPKIFDGFIHDGKLDFDTFKKAVQREPNARKFLTNYRKWQQAVFNEIKERKLMDERGNRIAKSFVTLFALFVPILVLILTNRLDPAFRTLLDYVRMCMFLCISAGITVLSMRKDVFSRWTKEGLLYYLRWKNFEKFLLDFSALSSYPPASVAIWDEYIVYAAALGIAKTVAENFKKLNPPGESRVASVVVVQPAMLDTIPATIRTASQTVSKTSSSSSGGFKGGSIGSGAGGSRIGAG
ncbi:hypothetical protein AS159_07070 [Thermotoga sp. Ku-13t]|uniref:DUF2207 domain-containing protein n=1 Tax=Thermotoga sp. Ku-13t TaxID=1755813 RepID=UPI0013ED51AA|nr:DUF2207 domain-containing protein [Thermotoga sp. Ku-13t]KAF2957431.1 hypothetical protein AS159_07070 [Thermotoga sp. Ku-13t]